MLWNAIDFNNSEFKRSRSFSDLAQRSLGLNVLKSFLSETNRLLTYYIFKLADNQGRQMSSKFGYIVHLALELLVLECLNSPYLTLSFA